MLKLQRYSFAIQHKKCSAMLLAYTLSRAPVSSVFKPDHNFEVFSADTLNTDKKPDRITDRTLELIKRATRDDPVLSHLISLLTPCNYSLFILYIFHCYSILYDTDRVH